MSRSHNKPHRETFPTVSFQICQNSGICCPYYRFLIHLIDYAITVDPLFLSPLFPFALYSPSHQHSPNPLTSCPWVVHVSSLASPFPILFLTSPCLFCTYSFDVFKTQNSPCHLSYLKSLSGISSLSELKEKIPSHSLNAPCLTLQSLIRIPPKQSVPCCPSLRRLHPLLSS